MYDLKKLAISPENTGLSDKNVAHCDQQIPNEFDLPNSAIQELKAMWSQVYGRTLSVNETLDIYRNVKHIAEIIV